MVRLTDPAIDIGAGEPTLRIVLLRHAYAEALDLVPSGTPSG
jgi:hypothetical protein